MGILSKLFKGDSREEEKEEKDLKTEENPQEVEAVPQESPVEASPPQA